MENLLEAWKEFVKGKRARVDVLEFECDLMENLFDLHSELASRTYSHGPYQAFTISDPKTRKIHKATVRDRVFHRSVYRKLYPLFDPTFIADSFSCRKNKGTHKALDQFVKHRLRFKHYIRYADDVVLLSRDRAELENLLPTIEAFLEDELRLSLHPSKVDLRTLASGVDFLGWVHFPDCRILRIVTKRRLVKAFASDLTREAEASYVGLLKHGNTFGIQKRIAGEEKR